MQIQLPEHLQELVNKRIDLDYQIGQALIAAFKAGISTPVAGTPTAIAPAPKVEATATPAPAKAPKPRAKKQDVTGKLTKILSGGGEFKAKDLATMTHMEITSVNAWLATAKKKGIVKHNKEAKTYSLASATAATAVSPAKAKPKPVKTKVSKKKV